MKQIVSYSVSTFHWITANTLRVENFDFRQRWALQHTVQTLFLSVFLMCLPGFAHSESPRQKVRDHVLQAEYQEAHRVLSQAQSDFLEGKIGSEGVRQLFSVFKTTDPDMISAIDEWEARSDPAQPIPTIAAAMYRIHVATLLRDGQYYSDLPNEIFNQVRSYADEGAELALRAASNDNNLVPAVEALVDLNFLTGVRASRDFIIERFIAKHEDEKIVHAYLQGLTPKWGGSVDRLSSFCKSMKSQIALATEMDEIECRVFGIIASDTKGQHRAWADRILDQTPQNTHIRARFFDAYFHRPDTEVALDLLEQLGWNDLQKASYLLHWTTLRINGEPAYNRQAVELYQRVMENRVDLLFEEIEFDPLNPKTALELWTLIRTSVYMGKNYSDFRKEQDLLREMFERAVNFAPHTPDLRLEYATFLRSYIRRPEIDIVPVAEAAVRHSLYAVASARFGTAVFNEAMKTTIFWADLLYEPQPTADRASKAYSALSCSTYRMYSVFKEVCGNTTTTASFCDIRPPAMDHAERFLAFAETNGLCSQLQNVPIDTLVSGWPGIGASF